MESFLSNHTILGTLSDSIIKRISPHDTKETVLIQLHDAIGIGIAASLGLQIPRVRTPEFRGLTEQILLVQTAPGLIMIAFTGGGPLRKVCTNMVQSVVERARCRPDAITRQQDSGVGKDVGLFINSGNFRGLDFVTSVCTPKTCSFSTVCCCFL